MGLRTLPDGGLVAFAGCCVTACSGLGAMSVQLCGGCSSPACAGVFWPFRLKYLQKLALQYK